MNSILYLDMTFTLTMIKERKLEQVLRSRSLGGFFDKVISVHPLSGLFESGDSRFGHPKISLVDSNHIFVEGKIGISPVLAFLPPLNLLLAQILLVSTLLRLARDSRVNVVRVGDPYYLGLIGLILSRILKVPLAIRVGFNYDELFKTTKRAAFPRLFKFRFVEKSIERLVFPRCKLVAGANQNNLEYALANGALRKYGVVFRYGNLIDPVHFIDPSQRSTSPFLLRDIGVNGEFLASVTRLEKMKNPDHSLFVFQILINLGHDLSLVYIGDGSMKDHLLALASSMGLADRVFFAGNRTQQWIASVLPQATLVLSPHMGRALTEACLAAVPIVAYDYDWQSELIRSGVSGELVPNLAYDLMAQAAHKLLRNLPYSRSLGNGARSLALQMMDPQALDQLERRSYSALLKEP